MIKNVGWHNFFS